MNLVPKKSYKDPAAIGVVKYRRGLKFANCEFSCCILRIFNNLLQKTKLVIKFGFTENTVNDDQAQNLI
jgi:hypothetical protein